MTIEWGSHENDDVYSSPDAEERDGEGGAQVGRERLVGLGAVSGRAHPVLRGISRTVSESMRSRSWPQLEPDRQSAVHSRKLYNP
jgi:hypothetical protein